MVIHDRRPRSLGTRVAFGLLALTISAPGCAIKLSLMAKQDASDALDCEEVSTRTKPVRPPYKEMRVSGCGEYRVYEGTCDGERNGCDRVGLDDPSCDGSCKLELTDSGTLDPPKPNSTEATAETSAPGA
jgi:hypothetical protein